jgi:hypothetical protein
MYFGVILLIFSILFAVLLLIYLGFFTSLTIKDSNLGPFPLLYRDFRGDLDKIDPLILKFRQDLSKYFNPDKTFKIYYDNPLAVSKKNNARAVYGLVLDQNEPLERIQKFCKRFEDIKFKILPEVTCIYMKVENKKSFRFNHSVFQAKILPKLVIALKEKLEIGGNDINFVGLMETQELRSVGDMNLRYAIPYGNDTNDYFLTNYPDPDYVTTK